MKIKIYQYFLEILLMFQTKLFILQTQDKIQNFIIINSLVKLIHKTT